MADASASVGRDPETSRRRLIEAAIVEFADHGFAGARVEAITARAGVSKQLAFYYYGSKAQLFRAALWAKLEAHRRDLENRLDFDSLTVSDEVYNGDRQLVRLLMWEALQVGDAGLDERDRIDMYQGWVRRIEDEQAQGVLTTSLAPEQVVLLFLAEGLFPAAFPQLVRMVTGHEPSESGFRDERLEFLTALRQILRPGPRPSPRSDE